MNFQYEKANYLHGGIEKRRDYALLSARNAESLSKDVQLKLEDGWRQWGPPFCNSFLDSAGHCLYQSVVKDIYVDGGHE